MMYLSLLIKFGFRLIIGRGVVEAASNWLERDTKRASKQNVGMAQGLHYCNNPGTR